MDRERTLLRGFANASRQLLVLELIAGVIIPLPPYNYETRSAGAAPVLCQGGPACQFLGTADVISGLLHPDTYFASSSRNPGSPNLTTAAFSKAALSSWFCRTNKCRSLQVYSV